MSQVGESAKTCAQRSACLYKRRGRGASFRPLALQLQSCDGGRRTISFVRLALKVVVQNDGEFMVVILLYLK